jgi:hypothetical protein
MVFKDERPFIWMAECLCKQETVKKYPLATFTLYHFIFLAVGLMDWLIPTLEFFNIHLPSLALQHATILNTLVSVNMAIALLSGFVFFTIGWGGTLLYERTHHPKVTDNTSQSDDTLLPSSGLLSNDDEQRVKQSKLTGLREKFYTLHRIALVCSYVLIFLHLLWQNTLAMFIIANVLFVMVIVSIMVAFGTVGIQNYQKSQPLKI